jgi:hypothetical protein
VTTRAPPSAKIDRLLHWMPIVVRAEGLSAWERVFCASIVARSRAGPWRPSARQIAVMRRIVSTFQARTLRADPVVAAPSDDPSHTP